MITAVVGNPWLTSSCRISHLGINPVRGGSPPRERSVRQANVLRAGALLQARARVAILVEPTLLSVRNIADVMVMYNISARRVIWGAIWATRIIQPKWAIEEYARIFRSWVWLRPPHPPIRAEKRARVVSR